MQFPPRGFSGDLKKRREGKNKGKKSIWLIIRVDRGGKHCRFLFLISLLFPLHLKYKEPMHCMVFVLYDWHKP